MSFDADDTWELFGPHSFKGGDDKLLYTGPPDEDNVAALKDTEENLMPDPKMPDDDDLGPIDSSDGGAISFDEITEAPIVWTGGEPEPEFTFDGGSIEETQRLLDEIHMGMGKLDTKDEISFHERKRDLNEIAIIFRNIKF